LPPHRPAGDLTYPILGTLSCLGTFAHGVLVHLA
jgi:hypothetical protein